MWILWDCLIGKRKKKKKKKKNTSTSALAYDFPFVVACIVTHRY